jgi:molybdopterin-containing oxidoreductase family membrane subunit
MWCERFIIVVTPLSRDYIPAVWDNYFPTFWDIATYLGSIGLFFTLLLLFLRALPMISISEMQHMIHKIGEENKGQARE